MSTAIPMPTPVRIRRCRRCGPQQLAFFEHPGSATCVDCQRRAREPKPETPSRSELTSRHITARRELVRRYRAADMPNREIAQRLGISGSTVEEDVRALGLAARGAGTPNRGKWCDLCGGLPHRVQPEREGSVCFGCGLHYAPDVIEIPIAHGSNYPVELMTEGDSI